MQFPSSGPLSMYDIAIGLEIEPNMDAFRNGILYNIDGTEYNPPQTGELSIFYFRGRYYTNPRPYIAPITVTYQTFTPFNIYPPPESRDPTKFTIRLYGAGGGGGGGGGGAQTGLACNNASGGGGGSGGQGGYYEMIDISYTNTITIQAVVGYRGDGGIGGNGQAGSTSPAPSGTFGTGGGSTIISINSVAYQAMGGSGGGGGFGGDPCDNGGAGGYAGIGGFPNPVNGNMGFPGSNANFSTNAGGLGGAATLGYSIGTQSGYGSGGKGGNGGGTDNEIAFGAFPGSLGGDGIIVIVWDYT